MKHIQSNYAFIDSQNLNLGIHSLGWKLDYKAPIWEGDFPRLQAITSV